MKYDQQWSEMSVRMMWELCLIDINGWKYEDAPRGVSTATLQRDFFVMHFFC